MLAACLLSGVIAGKEYATGHRAIEYWQGGGILQTVLREIVRI
jgi:hypothetical protein